MVFIDTMKKKFDPKYFISNSVLFEKLREIYYLGLKKVVISGGEPFDQSVGLLSLLHDLRAIGYDDILLYTGYPFEIVSKSIS